MAGERRKFPPLSYQLGRLSLWNPIEWTVLNVQNWQPTQQLKKKDLGGKKMAHAPLHFISPLNVPSLVTEKCHTWLGQVGSGRVRSGRCGFGWVRLGPVGSGQVKSGWVGSGCVSAGWCGSGLVGLGRVGLGALSGRVRLGQVGSDRGLCRVG